MLLTIADMVADDTTPDAGAEIRAAVLLTVLLVTGFFFYRRTTQGSRTLAETIRKRGIEPAVPVAPQPVLFGDREAAVGEGVDFGPVLARHPEFTALGVLSIARETFSLVRKARAEQIPRLADGLLAPPLRAQLDASIAADAEARRHHMFPMLDIASAAIVECAADDTDAAVTVRFDLTGAEVERDDGTGEVVSGDQTPRRWDERWTFRRPDDATPADQDRMMTHTAGGWLIPHQGWAVDAIVVGQSVTAELEDPVGPAASAAPAPAVGAAAPDAGGTPASDDA